MPFLTYARAAPILANIAQNYIRKKVQKSAAKIAGATAVAGAGGLLLSRKGKTTNTSSSTSTMVARKRVSTRKRTPATRGKVMRYRKRPTVVRRGRPPPAVINPDTQRAYVAMRTGKKISETQLIAKTAKASIQRSVFFWRQYNAEAVGGDFPLNLDHAGITGDTRYFPVYLFDLTARPQNVGGVVRDALFGCRACASTSGANDGKIRWVSIAGLTANSTASNWVQVDESTNLAGGQSSGRSLMNWVDIKAQIQGPRNIPSKIKFEIIRMLDDELDPVPQGSFTQDGTNSTAHQVYWQSFIAGCSVSPLHQYTLPRRKYVQVVATKEFVTEPRESVDLDTRGQLFVLKWFNRINKIMNYNNSGIVTTDDATFSSRTIVTNSSGNNVSTHADTKDKLWLRVSSYAPIATAGFDKTVHGSFELSVRMCHSAMV